jgi:hypothetical protein
MYRQKTNELADVWPPRMRRKLTPVIKCGSAMPAVNSYARRRSSAIDKIALNLGRRLQMTQLAPVTGRLGDTALEFRHTTTSDRKI